MLIKFRFPEVFFGMLLAIAVFAMGVVFSSQISPAFQPASEYTFNTESKSDIHEKGIWYTFTHDAASFFTFWLVVVGVFQLVLFWWQLRLFGGSLIDTKNTAEAAVRQANVAEDSFAKRDRPYILIYGPEDFQMSTDRALFPEEFYLSFGLKNTSNLPCIIEDVAIEVIRERKWSNPNPVFWKIGHDLLVNPFFTGNEQRKDIYHPLPSGTYNGKRDDVQVLIDAADGKSETRFLPNLIDAETPIFFRVIVKYKGVFSDHHETSALWVYDHIFNRFTPYGGTESNYIR